MLRRIIPLLLFFSTYALSAQDMQMEKISSIRFDTQKIDIGEKPYEAGKAYLYEFPYENTGTAPLIVNRVAALCPCLDVSFSTDPLPPGQRDTLRVLFTPTHASRYTHRLTVFSNSDRPGLNLFVRGTFLKPSEMKEEQP